MVGAARRLAQRLPRPPATRACVRRAPPQPLVTPWLERRQPLPWRVPLHLAPQPQPHLSHPPPLSLPPSVPTQPPTTTRTRTHTQTPTPHAPPGAAGGHPGGARPQGHQPHRWPRRCRQEGGADAGHVPGARPRRERCAAPRRAVPCRSGFALTMHAASRLASPCVRQMPCAEPAAIPALAGALPMDSGAALRCFGTRHLPTRLALPPVHALRSQVGAVVVGFDRNINYYKIQMATLCIRENPGCLFIATNTGGSPAPAALPAPKYAWPHVTRALQLPRPCCAGGPAGRHALRPNSSPPVLAGPAFHPHACPGPALLCLQMLSRT